MSKENPKNKPLVEAVSEDNSPATSDSIVSASKPKKNNFPAGATRNRPVKILPSHRAVFQNYKDNGFKNLAKAIRKTKVYSEGVATRSQNITKSKSWQALMDEEMPEEKLAVRHAELLDKRDYLTEEITDKEGNVKKKRTDDGPNTQAVSKGLELAYRLRGSFKEKETATPSTVMYNLFYKPEIRDQMKTFEEGIRQSLYNEVARKNQKDIDTEQQKRADQAGSSGDTQEDGIRDAEVEDSSGE